MTDRTLKVRTTAGWMGFDLVQVLQGLLEADFVGDIVAITGCLTTDRPMEWLADTDVKVATFECTLQLNNDDGSPRNVFFMAPSSMSRYDAIDQCATSVVLTSNGELYINFPSKSIPLVLHLSGLVFSRYKGRKSRITLTESISVDGRRQTDGDVEQTHVRVPTVHETDGIVFLQGVLKRATYTERQHIGELPAEYKPQRVIRRSAMVQVSNTRNETLRVEHSVSMTLTTDGNIWVEGVQIPNTSEKVSSETFAAEGQLTFDGIFFSVRKGVPIELNTSLRSKSAVETSQSTQTAVCIMHNHLVLLEGSLEWTTVEFNPKQCIATLPHGHHPRQRQIFFTCGADTANRQRVDIDVHGRLFCPESTTSSFVELSGIAFVPSETNPDREPKDPDWDDFRVRYQRNQMATPALRFDDYSLFTQFARRCNYAEWNKILTHFNLATSTPLHMPLPDNVQLRGVAGSNDFNMTHNLSEKLERYREALKQECGIDDLRQLLHLSEPMLIRVADKISLSKETLTDIRRYRVSEQQRLRHKQVSGLTRRHLEVLADELAHQMVQYWDLKSQLSDATAHALDVSQSTVQHAFGKDSYRLKWQQDVIDALKLEDWPEFGLINQFFRLYETTSAQMTHCSLMDRNDMFTSTGKWYFPDVPAVQKQLFDKMTWLSDRNVPIYVSEKLTEHFSFVEDINIQAPKSWGDWVKEKRLCDYLVFRKPEESMDPGETIKWRALAIHRLFPACHILKCVVYSSAMCDHNEHIWKFSSRLVWPELNVDTHQARRIRHSTLQLFKQETQDKQSWLSHINYELMKLHGSNGWDNVFDDKTISAATGVSLPYTKTVGSPSSSATVLEAVGIISFKFEKGHIGNARWVTTAKDLSKAEWMLRGSCRRQQFGPSR